MPGIEIRVEIKNTIPTLDFAFLSIGGAHQELGKAVAVQVDQILQRRFQIPSHAIDHARKILAGNQISKITRPSKDSSIPTILRQAL